MAKPLADHLTALTSLREDIEELLCVKDLRSDAVEKLARARIAVSDTIHHLREAYAAAGLRKTV